MQPKSLVVDDPAKIALIAEALKAYKIPQTIESAYTEAGSQPMGGQLPPAVTMNKPASKVTDSLGLDYPPKGDKTMATKQLGGERLSVPDADTVPSNIKSEESVTAGSKPSQKPGDVHDTFPTVTGADASTVTSMDQSSPRTSLTPGSGKKGTFSATNDPKDTSAAALPGKPFKEEEDEEDEEDEEAKAFRHIFTYTKAFSRINKAKAKYALEEAMAQYANGQSARSVLEEIRAKIEEALGGVSQAPTAGALGQAAPQALPTAAPVAGAEENGAGALPPGALSQAPTPAPSIGGAPSPIGAGPGMSDEDMEAFKALKALGEGLSSGRLTLKQYTEAISSVFQPKGGSDNFTNLRSPGQPPAKVAAIPGRSGSSEVFRTDTGSKGGVGMTREAQLNPPATLETAKDEPIATYETPTKLTSGPGYQMDILRDLSDGDIRKRGMPRGSTNFHPSLVKFFNLRSNEATALGDHASKETVDVVPRGMEEGTLKFIQSSHVPTKEELADMARKGELDTRLLQKAEPIPTENPSGSQRSEGVLMKGLKRLVDSA